VAGYDETMADRENPLLYPLFKDLDGVLNESARPIADALRRYQGRDVQWLVSLAHELAFFLGAIQLIGRLEEQGLPVCQPLVAPREERRYHVRASYNLALALRLQERANGQPVRDLIVTNDTDFGPPGWVAIVTGPNQGGKTTFVQSVGLTQLLFQAGLFVPGEEATISPADAIYTLFAGEEKPERDTGRLGEEASRVSQIFGAITGDSLVLLNEIIHDPPARAGPKRGRY
jgi:DNA mismatch repair ATPase MutS